jgi:hypothetical protein
MATKIYISLKKGKKKDIYVINMYLSVAATAQKSPIEINFKHLNKTSDTLFCLFFFLFLMKYS